MADAGIVVFGSINLDLVVFTDRFPKPGETLTGHEVFEAPGGKGANQAVAATKLGGSVAMVGRVGDDRFGESLLDSLCDSGVGIDLVQKTENCASGAAVVVVDQDGENSIIVTPGSNGRLSVSDIENATSAIASAGVMLLQLEIPTETVVAAIEAGKKAGVRVILDPAPAPSTVAAGLLQADLIKPNQTEAAAILGKPMEDVEAAEAAVKELVALGPKEAIITLGSEGAVWSDGSRLERAHAPEVTPVDSTAAGDAFTGALGLMLAQGANTVEAMRFACAAGAAATTNKGAQQAMPTLADVKALLP